MLAEHPLYVEANAHHAPLAVTAMTAVLAWVWAPVLLYLVAAGVGLLATGVLRVKLPAALVAPVGLGLSTVFLVLAYRVFPAGAVPVLLVLALAGFVLGRRELRERLWDPAAFIAAALVYALYLGPVVLSGEASWAGYNFVNDTAVNFLLADALAHHGFTPPGDVSGTAVTLRAFLGFGYPLGAFTLPGGLQPLTGAPLEAIYQPFIALFAAFGAMSLSELARRAGLGRIGTVVAAALPFGGVLIYRYALHGSIKEVLLVTLVLTGLALAAVAAERQLEPRVVVLVGLTMLAAILAFSFAAASYALVLGAVMFAWAYLSDERPSTRQVGIVVGAIAVVGLLVLLPTLGSALEFAKAARASFSNSKGDVTAQFGQLVRPLPLPQAAGVWINGDYRYPSVSGFNTPLIVVMGLTALAGLVLSTARRHLVPLGMLLVFALPLAVLAPSSSPYIDGKLMVIATPVVVFLAVVAVFRGLAVSKLAVRAAAGVALALVAGGVLASDIYGYRDTRVAPEARIDAMKDVAAHAPADRLYLLNEWEEYGKFFMRAVRVNPSSEATSPAPVRLRRDQPIFGRWFDLDQQQLAYVQQFRGIIMRRSPSASRPPANYRLAYANDYYELWLRRSGPRVVAHLPLQRPDVAAVIPRCGAVRALAARARPGDRLLAAERPRVATVSPLLVRRPGYWPKSAEAPNTVTPVGEGSVFARPTAGGELRVWLRTSTMRKFTVLIDGRRVGTAGQVNSPGQWVSVATVRLRPGMHRVQIRRPRSSLGPGQGINGYLGPLALESVGRSRLVRVDPADASRLCGRPLDWIELVRGR